MRKSLSLKELFIMGGALFSMHFGASCMLYPVTWGKEAGTALPLMYIGIFLSAILLPLLGYVALAKGGGDFLQISMRASPGFGRLFAALTILVMGPVYIVPRMSAAAWSAIVQLTGWNTESLLPVLLFSIVYYIITYWFVSSSGKVVSRVGNILFPILVVIVIAVIVKSLVTPISDSWTAPAFKGNPVVHGVIQGYATGDLQCALMFGLIVVHGIENAGIEKKDINKNMLLVGIVGLGMLALTHLGHMIAGANLGGTIDLSLSALYTEMVLQLWGRAGGILFNVALIAAALTTAIGCVSSTAEIWVEMLGGRFSYRKVCVFSCVLSCAVSAAGLDTIVTAVGPILDACYPAAIVLSFYYCFCPRPFEQRSLVSLHWAMAAALLMGFLNALNVYTGIFGWKLPEFKAFYQAIPLAKYSLAWVPVSLITFTLAFLTAKKAKAQGKRTVHI